MRPASPPRAAAALVLALVVPSGVGATAQARPSPEAGRALAAELGCGACHAGAPDAAPALGRVPPLGPGSPPLPADFVFTWLADPQPRREGIGPTRMPDFHLDEGERVALALFLGEDDGASGALAGARVRHPDADAAAGRRIYGALGCGGCHAGVPGAPPVRAPDLSREGARVRAQWLDAFLAAPTPVRGPAHPTAPGARMPDFRLAAAERSVLAAWLMDRGEAFARLPTEPLTPTQTARTARFLEDRASCLGCHRIQGRGGAIGPSLEGAARRLTPDFVLEMILDPGRAAPGSPMPHQPMPRREADRLARYLLDVGAGDDTPATRRSLADAGHPAWVALTPTGDPGEGLYTRHCAACHGPGGGGNGWNAPNLPVPPTAHAEASLMARRVDDALYDGIHGGAWVLDGSPRMPPFGGLLSAGEIRDLVGYIRRLCACQAPAWSRDGRRGGSGR